MHSVLSYCSSMDRFVTRVGKPTQHVAILGDHWKSVAPESKGTGKRLWHNWSLLEKEEAALQFVHAGLKSWKMG